MQRMKTPEEIKAHIQATVAAQLPQIEPGGVREWISARLTEPRPVMLSEAPDGKTSCEFWLATDHVDGQHDQIAYSPDDDACLSHVARDAETEIFAVPRSFNCAFLLIDRQLEFGGDEAADRAFDSFYRLGGAYVYGTSPA